MVGSFGLPTETLLLQLQNICPRGTRWEIAIVPLFKIIFVIVFLKYIFNVSSNEIVVIGPEPTCGTEQNTNQHNDK